MGIMYSPYRILRAFPFPDSVLSLFASCPIISWFSSYFLVFPISPHLCLHTLLLCVCGVLIVLFCTSPQRSFCSSLLLPLCGAYVFSIVMGVCASLQCRVIRIVLLLILYICYMISRHSRISIATPPCDIPGCGLCFGFCAAEFMNRYPLIM